MSVPNDAERLCDSSLEPWTHCIREAYIGKRGDGTCNHSYKCNSYEFYPERQIQSQLLYEYTVNYENKKRKPFLVHLQGLEPWTH